MLVADLGNVEERVDAEGIGTFNRNAIAPVRRLCFFDCDDICWEVASYAAPETRGVETPLEVKVASQAPAHP